MPIYGHNAIAGALGGNTGNIRAASGGDRGLLWGAMAMAAIRRAGAGARSGGLAGLRASGASGSQGPGKMFFEFGHSKRTPKTFLIFRFHHSKRVSKTFLKNYKELC